MSKPKIRVKGYKDDWEQRKLGEAIIEYKETVDPDCTLPVLTSSKTEGVILQEEHFGRKQNHDITGYNILPRNYCTYRNRSDGVDFTFNLNKCCDKGIISKFYPVFYGNDNDTFFISLVLNNSDEVIREIGYTCTGTGQKVLSFLDLQKMNIKLPSYNEQRKISLYFSHLDHLITLHQRKCDETKKLKKYMLQKMFPQNGNKVPEIRFFGFTDDWEQRKFEEVCSEIGDGLHSAPEYDDNGKFFFINGNNLINGHIAIDSNETKRVSKSTFEKNNKHLDDNTVLLSINGTIGNLAYYQGEQVMLGKSVAYLKANKIDKTFLYNSLQTRTVLNNFMLSLTGTTIKNLGLEAIKNTKIIIPKLNEQEKIGSYFSKLDNLITLHHRKYEELQKIKKFMLQNMFV